MVIDKYERDRLLDMLDESLECKGKGDIFSVMSESSREVCRDTILKWLLGLIINRCA